MRKSRRQQSSPVCFPFSLPTCSLAHELVFLCPPVEFCLSIPMLFSYVYDDLEVDVVVHVLQLIIRLLTTFWFMGERS